YCIEPSLGADRVTLAFLCDAYDEEELEGGDSRTVLRFHPALAPFKAAVLPLSKKLAEQATDVWAELRKAFPVDYDESQSIGKRYRRQDEIGTPFCITYDFDSVEDGQVTVRHRDSMEQTRMPIVDVKAYIEKHLAF
ncbi:MAG TPA: His/Gly/Thr/Pro-type tRNA ligase C-terminal domain-containing protein, partial [Rummeliibacillus sp.]|nr:His/Gly/Thr/Pro-type tRNA ligase C-terminal domain-containing protein [Rummeliibacillus sp.]